MPTAALVIAHGSRRKSANDDLYRLAEMIRGRGVFDHVEEAFLELAEPKIPEGAAACLAAGATEVKFLPFFLSGGVHVGEDLEEHRQRLAAENPGVSFTLCPPLGLHELIVDLMIERSREEYALPTDAPRAYRVGEEH